MGKTVHDDVLDGALNIVKNACNKTTLCTLPPTTYAQATSTYMVAEAAMASGDFTAANGDSSGRKCTVGSKSSTVTNTGVGTHVALVDTATSRLLYTTLANLKRQNTAQAGGASTITLDASASATDSEYNNHHLVIVSGTGAGQERKITGYVGATKVATVDTAWTTQPTSSSVFAVYGQHMTSGNNMTFNAWTFTIADPT